MFLPIAANRTLLALALVGESARLGEDVPVPVPVPWARRVCRVLKDTFFRAGENLVNKKKEERAKEMTLCSFMPSMI